MLTDLLIAGFIAYHAASLFTFLVLMGLAMLFVRPGWPWPWSSGLLKLVLGLIFLGVLGGGEIRHHGDK
ncbi:MAG: hypothetical protein KA806_10640 [Sulfuritalea sp.]|nr:hypothetical protein [Sulfuritalea sp.]